MSQNNRLVVTQLAVEVLSVGASLHGDLEDTSDKHVVVLGQGLVVRVGERDSELLIGVVDALAESLSSERKTSGEPKKALGGITLLLILLVKNNVLQGLRSGRALKLLFTNLLDVTSHVLLDSGKGSGAKQIKQSNEGLRSLKELGGADLVIGRDRDVLKVLLDTVKKSGSHCFSECLGYSSGGYIL